MRAYHVLLLVVLWVLLAIWSAPVRAQTNCKPREEMVELLTKKYKESRRVYAFVSPVRMLELFVSASGTWTALVSSTNGTSCMVAAGTGWTEEDLPKAGTAL